MSDSEKKEVTKKVDEVKPDVDQGKPKEPSQSTSAQNTADIQDDIQRTLEAIFQSNRAQNTADTQDDIQRTLEAIFQLNRAKVCSQMWRNFNS